MNISEQVSSVNELTDAVRTHINTHRYQSTLLDDSKLWNQICSSLDVIEDSLLAVDSYSSENYPDDTGLKYIYTYGLLQALFLMQDSLRHLSEAFDIQFELSSILKEIRNFRNASIGHPTKQDQKGQRYYNYIIRISISKGGFDLMRSTGDREHSTVHVDIAQACSDQLYGIIEAYRKITEKLEEIDRMHKEKFKESPVSDIFHSAMGYFFEKISQGIHAHSYGDRLFGHENVRHVKETYEKFKSSLQDRNELHEYTEYDLNVYFHALGKLDEYLSDGETSMEEADARIYLSFLRHEHEHFVAIAKEIDEDYQTKA